MSKLGFITNCISSTFRNAPKLAQILLITFLIIYFQKRTPHLIIDNIRNPQIDQFNPTPHQAKTSYPKYTNMYIPQPDYKQLVIKQAKAYFPYLSLCHTIGLWNFIYLLVTTTVLGVWDLNRNIAIPGGKRVHYIPK